MGTTTATLATSSTPDGRPRLRVLPGGLLPSGQFGGAGSRKPDRDGAPRSDRGGGPRSDRTGVPVPAVRTRRGSVTPPLGDRRGVRGGALLPLQPARRGSVMRRDQPARPPATRRVGGAAAARPVPARLRLTRRGRVVVRWAVLVLALLVAFVLVLALSRPASAGSRSNPVPVRYHVVLPGETLWGIAGEVAPNIDRREVIARIVELNALPGSGVTVGQRIALPPSA